MPTPILVLALLALAQQPAQQPAQPAPTAPPDKAAPPEKPVDVHAEHPARASFLANCAQCHGETGDGKGTTKLDRDARSFQLGGFSYGNTPEALERSITFGIPGTPMPSFEKALKPAERRSLAEYVLLLGPPAEKTDPKDSVLVVKDKPLFVRGKLPPLVEGGPAFPRAVLLGTPEGLSFAWRVDDVQLLGVLKGEFVDRADWRGRGGDPLKPLGKAVHLREPDDDAWVFARFGQGTRRQLGATVVLAGVAALQYELVGNKGQRLARVLEKPRSFACSIGGGYARRFEIEPAVADPESFLSSQKPKGALVELKLRRGLPSPRKDLLLLEEVTLPGVLWPADAAERKKLVDTFLAEAVR